MLLKPQNIFRCTSITLGYCRPQPVGVEPEAIELGLLAGAARDYGSSPVVDIEHEFGGLLPRVAEQFLEHPRDVRHEIDRVVPDDHQPRPIRLGLIAGFDLFGSPRRGRRLRGHASTLRKCGRPLDRAF
jgi:hypothetical protein